VKYHISFTKINRIFDLIKYFFSRFLPKCIAFTITIKYIFNLPTKFNQSFFVSFFFFQVTINIINNYCYLHLKLASIRILSFSNFAHIPAKVVKKCV